MLRRSHFLHIIAAFAAVVIAAALAAWILHHVTQGHMPAGTAANLWVDADGGTCDRSSSPATYDDAAACDSFQSAYDASAAGGDTIVVKAGSYPAQQVLNDNHSGQSGPMTTFKCERPRTCILDDNLGEIANVGHGYDLAGFIWGNGGHGPSWVTIDGFDMGQFGWDGTGTTRITFKNNWVHEWCLGGCASPETVPLFAAGVDHLIVQNNEIGPACCGGDGIEPSGPLDNAIITGNYIHDIYDTCGPGDGRMNRYGAQCKGKGFGDGCGDCDHIDAMQLQDGRNLQITHNRIYNAGTQGLFMENASSSRGVVYDNTLIAGNMIGQVCGGVCGQVFTFGSNQRGAIDGNIRVLYNTVNGAISLGGGNTSQDFADTATVTVVGNIATAGVCMKIGITTCDSRCRLGKPSGVFTPTYSNNVLSGGTCGGPKSSSTAPALVSTSAFTPNLHLSGSQFAIDGGESSFCGAGNTVTDDVDGDARPLGTACDIGADEAR